MTRSECTTTGEKKNTFPHKFVLCGGTHKFIFTLVTSFGAKNHPAKIHCQNVCTYFVCMRVGSARTSRKSVSVDSTFQPARHDTIYVRVPYILLDISRFSYTWRENEKKNFHFPMAFPSPPSFHRHISFNSETDHLFKQKACNKI